MSQKIQSRIGLGLIALVFSVTLAGRPARAAVDAACKLVLDAVAKQLDTPSHVYMTEVRGGKRETKESVYAGGVIYIQVKGKWRRSPMSKQDVLKQEEENKRDAKESCRYLRDEAVNGEAAAVYHAQAENGGVKSDSTFWISKRTGLPLRNEEDIDTGDNDKWHMSIRYDYAGVQAPAGVK
ncbi:MAG TPA: hypothetical protein VLX28_09425 [Thermoanaerobaculia bacterium]|nr:hypothetical protein [Thermoanaerobaculia bacterium]